MATNVVPLRHPTAPPTRAELASRVRANLIETGGALTLSLPHVPQRMLQRGVVMRQILDTIEKGEVTSGPTKDEYGDWRIKFMRKTCGRRVQVVVAVREKSFLVVTVI